MSGTKATKARIPELQGVIDKLKEEEANLKARLGEAESNLYEAQREVRRNQKPTPAMLAVLGMLVSGEAIRRNSYSFSMYTHNQEGKTVKVRDSIFFGLCEREALSRNGSEQVWHISDHGRAVLERWSRNKDKAA